MSYEFDGQLPDLRSIRAGALAFVAAFAMQPGNLHDAVPHIGGIQPTAELVEPASGGDAVMGTSSSTAPVNELGVPQERQLERGVPSLVQSYIDSHSIVINAIRCSGSLIYNQQRQAIGALTAAHCLLNDRGNTRLYVGADKQDYLVSSAPVIIESGIDEANLQSVGNVQDFIIAKGPDPSGNESIDQAIALLPGSNPIEAMQAVQAEQLSQKGFENLTPNRSKIYLSGFPYTQNGDASGNMIRQEFVTTLLGGDLAQGIDGGISAEGVYDASDKTNSDGAICSWGTSGGQALALITKRTARGVKQFVKQVGVFSSFGPFRAMKEKGGSQQVWTAANAKQASQYAHAQFPHAHWKGVATTCGYGNDTLSESNYRLVQVTDTIQSVPAPAENLNDNTGF